MVACVVRPLPLPGTSICSRLGVGAGMSCWSVESVTRGRYRSRSPLPSVLCELVGLVRKPAGLGTVAPVASPGRVLVRPVSFCPPEADTSLVGRFKSLGDLEYRLTCSPHRCRQA